MGRKYPWIGLWGGAMAYESMEGGTVARVDECYVIDVAGVSVHVTHKDVKNVNFRVGRDGIARMSVPRLMPRGEVERVAKRHLDWIVRSQQNVRRKAEASSCTWETGGTLMVWGESRTLRITSPSADLAEPSCALIEDELVVRVWDSASPQEIEYVVERWLADQLGQHVREILPMCEERVGRHASHITLRRMKSRWGSCTARTGRIRLNVALAECPPACTEMVLVHELCHLIEPNHGPRFHALMDLNCPGWRACDQWLNEHPPRVLGS